MNCARGRLFILLVVSTLGYVSWADQPTAVATATIRATTPTPVAPSDRSADLSQALPQAFERYKASELTKEIAEDVIQYQRSYIEEEQELEILLTVLTRSDASTAATFRSRFQPIVGAKIVKIQGRDATVEADVELASAQLTVYLTPGIVLTLEDLSASDPATLQRFAEQLKFEAIEKSVS